MRFLESFSLENQRIRNILSTVSELKGYQGSVIRFSDNFLQVYCRWKINPRYFRNLKYFDTFPRPRIHRFHFGDSSNYINLNTLSAYSQKIDFEELKKFKRDIQYIDETGLLENELIPIELVISIFNDADASAFDRIVHEYEDNDQYDFRVIIERRGKNIFLSSSRKVHDKIKGGLSIGADDSNYFGTLGGILKSKDNKVFGLTCAHVVDKGKVYQPARSDSKKAREIGNVEISNSFNWSSICNPRNISASTPTNMDASLIALNQDLSFEQSVHNLGKIVARKSFGDIHQGMCVEFNGRSTGKRKILTVGGLCPAYLIGYKNDNKFACFTNLIELRESNPTIIGNKVIQTIPVEEGDSGSWICSNDENGYNWCGMLISGDCDRGYFIAAEDIDRWLKSEGYNLEPYETVEQFNIPQIHVNFSKSKY